MGLPHELHRHVTSTKIAAQVVVFTAKFTNSATADATVPVFVAPRKMKYVGGKYVQAVDATAVTTFVASVKVGATAISEELDIKTLADDTAGALPASTTEENRVVAAGSVIDILFNEAGGTVTAPGDVLLALEFQYLE